MIAYILRRAFYGVLILLGVNLITFALFFSVNTPDDMARLSLGGKYVTPELIASWKTRTATICRCIGTGRKRVPGR